MWRRAVKETPLKHLKKMSLSKARPSPIILTLEVKLISIQKELKSVMGGELFQNTKAKAQNRTKSMVYYNALQKFLIEKDIHFFTYCTKAEKPVKAIIRHSIGYISAQGITVALQERDYNIISVKQMTAKHPTMVWTWTLPSLSAHRNRT
jgi:hypothetical protein